MSRNSPTGFPTAAEIVNGILRVLTPGNPSTLAELRDLADWSRPSKRSPGDYIRFEQLLEAIHSLADPDLSILGLVELYTDSNPLHCLLARRALAGDIIVTTNFDCLIEDAILALGGEPVTVCRLEEFGAWKSFLSGGRTPVFKLHGSYWRYDGRGTRDCAIETAQATLEAVAAGGAVMRLPEPKRSFLLECTRKRRMVVAGYSGSDDLDIMPTFQELDPAEVIWIDHGPGLEDISDSIRDRVLRTAPGDLSVRERFFRRMLEESAPRLRVIRAETSPFLHDHVGLALPAPEHSSGNNRLEEFLDRWSADHLRHDYQRHLVIGGLLRILARAERAVDHLRTAERDCARIPLAGDDLAKIYNLLSNAEITLGRYADAEKSVRLAESLLPPGESALRAMVVRQKGFVQYNFVRLDAALSLFREAERIARAVDHPATISDALHNIAMVHQDRANYEEARRYYQESIRFGEQAGQIRHVAFTHHQLGTLSYDLAEFTASLASFEQANNLAATLGDQELLASALHGLGLVAFQAGEISRALRYFRTSASIERSLGRTSYLPISWQHVGICLLEAERLARAESYLLQARDGYRAVQDPANLSELLSYLGQCYLERGEPAQAASAMQEAEELANQAELQVNVIRAQHMMGILQAKTGRSQDHGQVEHAILASDRLGAKILVLDLVYLTARAGLQLSGDPRLAPIVEWTARTYREIGNAGRAGLVERL